MATSSDANSEEIAFVKLFTEVHNKIQESNNISDDEILFAMNDIKEKYKLLNSEGINFESVVYICAYLRRYGPHSAGLTRCKILQAVDKCTELQEIIYRPRSELESLNVVILGGGPGNDVVGLCSALCQRLFSGKLQVTVVDAALQWRNCLELLYSILSVQGMEFGDASRIFKENLILKFQHYKFLPYHRTNPRNTTIYSTLESADIILTCKFFTGMNFNTVDGILQVIF